MLLGCRKIELILSVLWWHSQVRLFVFVQQCHFHSTFVQSNIRVKKDSLTWHLTSVYSPKNVLKYTFFLFVCWLWINRPNREFFTHMESSHYRGRAANYFTMLGTHDHWALRVLYRATHTVTSVYNGLDGGCACWPYHVICSWWWDD